MLHGGDGDTLTSSESVIENNYLHHTGEVYKQGVAIELQGVGHVVRNNLIHDTPRMAILAMGNDHLIELNRIHHTNLETADTGAIYATGRNWLDSRGLVIRYNEILDSVGFGFDFTEKKWKSPHFAFGIYLDDNASGVDIIGNVIGRSSWAAVMIHGGSYNQVRNNIFFDSGLSQAYFMTLGPNNPFMKTGAQKHAEFATKTAWKKYRGFADVQPDEVNSMADTVFERNVVAYSGAASNYVLTRGLPIDSSRIDRNLLLRRESDIKIDDGSKAGLSWEQWKALGLDSNSVVSDATLAAAANRWRTFASTALARRIGFVQIPFAKIGPYKSPERVTWPIVEAPTIHETLH